MIGLIEIKLEGATLEQTERYRLLLTTLLSSGALDVKNGSATLHFDFEGTLQEVETHVKRWRKPRDVPNLPQKKGLQ